VVAGASDGHAYRYRAGPWSDEGVVPNAQGAAVNTLCVSTSGILYGGTGSSDPANEGHLFRVGARENYDDPPGSGAVKGITYNGKQVHLARGDTLYSFTTPTTYNDLGSPQSGVTINDIDSRSGTVWAGLNDGHLKTYTEGGAFEDKGAFSTSSPVTSVVARSFGTVYVGLADGNLLNGYANMDGPALATLPSAIGDLAYKESATGAATGLYIATADGKLSRWNQGTLTLDDLGDGGDSTAANAVAVYGDTVFVGHESGNLLAYNGAWSGKGTCSSAIRSMGTGAQGVICGTGAGNTYIYDTLLRDQGDATAPASAISAICHINSSEWLGTQSGRLASRDDANLGGLGQQVKKQIMIWCMAYDPVRQVFYAGTYRNAHFLVIDPAHGNAVTDLGRPVDGERELEDILVASDGTVYGSTYGGTEEYHNPDGGHLFKYDLTGAPGPASGSFVDCGKVPSPDGNWWVSKLVEGPGSSVLGATCCSADERDGSLFSYDGSFTTLGSWPAWMQDEGARGICLSGGRIYGGTWDPADDKQSNVFSYDIVAGTFGLIGETPANPASGDTTNRHINSVRMLGSRLYCSQNNGYVFSFDPADPQWGSIVPTRPDSSCESVWPLATSQDGTLLCGTTGRSGGAGRLASFDPGLGEFRDVDVAAVSGQDRIASIGVGPGVVFCGTRGSASGADREAGKLVRIDRYASGSAKRPLSTVVDPGVDRVAQAPDPFAGQDGIGAVCAAPGDAKQVCVGTANSAADAQFLIYDSLQDRVLGSGPVTALAGQHKVLAMAPAPDGKVYVGTGNETSGADAHLLSFDPARYPEPPQDLGALTGVKGIFSVVAGPDGRIYFGGGDFSAERGHLYSYSSAEGFVDRGSCEPGSGRVTGLVSTGGRIYGVTSSQPGLTGASHFFSHVPGTTSLIDAGAAFGTEVSANALVSGPGGRLYCGTGPAGKLFSCTLPSTVFTEEPGPGSEVRSLTATATALYGCAGDRGDFFRLREGVLTDLGPLTTDNIGVRSATTDNLGDPWFGTTGNGAAGSTDLVRYDQNASFDWDEAQLDTTTPPSTAASVDLRNVADDADLKTAVTNGMDISDITERALRLKASLSTSDPTVTPAIDRWGVSWNRRPSVDMYEYPHAEGVYRGESLRIWGSDFGSSGTIRIGGHDAVVENWYEHFISAVVPQEATSGAVVIRRSDSGMDSVAAATPEATLLSEPLLTSISPTSARLGDVVQLHGSGFMGARGTGDDVSFGGAVATSYPGWSDTLILAQVPPGTALGGIDVRVSVNTRSSNTRPLTVLPGGGPTVSITSPADGATVSGSVEVAAAVQKQGGPAVELWVDGVKKATKSSAPYTFTWDAGGAIDGIHGLAVKATDGYGRQSSDTHTVFVNSTVPTEGKDWYFAEGCTDYGFETWLLIGNPRAEQTFAHITFLDDTGRKYPYTAILPPNSRTTVNAADIVPGANVSIQVSAEAPVVCERAMYWNDRIEGHSTIGTTSPARTWYFAEGSTDWGFETFVLLCNPGSSATKTTLTYMFPDGTSAIREHDVGPFSRVTVNATDDVGVKDFSIKVEAPGSGVVAERSMYHGGRRCGTGTIGCKEPSLSWYLSEGSTDWGFETWLLIERPAPGDARVRASFRKASGEVVNRTYTVKGNSRYTVNLATEVGTADVSTQVASDVGVVCERSMYWNSRSAGHCTIGSPGPGTYWYLAEGCSDYGFETWVLLDNPASTAVDATLTFMKQDGTNVPVTITLKPHSRLSVDASRYVGAASFSTRVQAARPIMVERAMYWNGRTGGTGSIGAR
jgi:hypothetical protein